MRISELPYAGSVTDSDYVLAVQNGQTVRATATAFKGGAGINGVGVPAGGAAGEVLKKVDGTDYNTEWGSAFSEVVNLTSATSDYALSVGETAYINFSSEASIPLNVATEDGLYEIEIYTLLNASAIDATMRLLPNNISSGTAFQSFVDYVDKQTTDSTGSLTWAAYHINGDPAFRLWSASGRTKLEVSTFIEAKTIFEHSLARRVLNATTNIRPLTAYSSWNDTTTDWTSLGTITCSVAISGKIVIKRII